MLRGGVEGRGPAPHRTSPAPPRFYDRPLALRRSARPATRAGARAACCARALKGRTGRYNKSHGIVNSRHPPISRTPRLQPVEAYFLLKSRTGLATLVLADVATQPRHQASFNHLRRTAGSRNEPSFQSAVRVDRSFHCRLLCGTKKPRASRSMNLMSVTSKLLMPTGTKVPGAYEPSLTASAIDNVATCWSILSEPPAAHFASGCCFLAHPLMCFGVAKLGFARSTPLPFPQGRPHSLFRAAAQSRDRRCSSCAGREGSAEGEGGEGVRRRRDGEMAWVVAAPPTAAPPTHRHGLHPHPPLPMLRRELGQRVAEARRALGQHVV